MLGRALSIAAFLFAASIFGDTASLAQDAASPGKTILVLDASGSMWGQIDGITKIEIAREVINGLLDTLPDEVELGLTAYGHREKGNCDDIESLVPAQAGSAGAIRQAIATINPKGMTPLSRAVQLAAEELKYEEAKATVILVSDGIETCDYDPCAVGADLERLGVDFTAHVIGFDVAEQEAREQLQCLAENTGGRFLTASNADELAAALEEVSVSEPEPEAVKADAVFEATDGEGGPVIKSDLTWTVTGTATGDAVVDGLDIGVLRMPMTVGEYEVQVVRRKDGAVATLAVEVSADAPNSFVLPIIVELPEASVAAAAEAPLGATIPVEWTGPDEKNDYIAIAKPDARGSAYENYVYTRDGSPAKLMMPSEPGDYEIRYILNQDNRILATAPITVVAVEASVSAAAEAPLGATIPVEWTGPDEKNDYIAIAKPDARGGDYENYVYTRDGSPAKLMMPSEPGDYEIRYILNQDNRILATAPITVVAVEASVSAAAEAPLGATIPVEWTGPDEKNDYIAIAKPDASGGDYENYVYTREGSPAKLMMPSEPGDYEIRYILNQDNRILATAPITVTAVEATLSAASSAPAGTEIKVEWTGPGYDNDYLTVAEPDTDGHDYINYTYTREGSPLVLELPDEPGDYEIRYILNQDNRILAAIPITVE